VFRRPEDSMDAHVRPSEERPVIVVAGPGSATTIPGIVASEIVLALAETGPVTRIEVDLGLDFTVGLHRAPSLAIAHVEDVADHVVRHRAPDSARFRSQAFKRWLSGDVGTAVAFVWPGIDNSWVKQYVQIANAASVKTVVACASLPRPSHARALTLSESISRADLVLVGDEQDAAALRAEFGPAGPTVKVHPALELTGTNERSHLHTITAFLPRDGAQTLATVLAAFDAIPEAWIQDYQLRIVMRHTDPMLPEMIDNCFHSDHIRLIDGDLSGDELEELCRSSSILTVADPAMDSRAFATAVECGIATVVLSSVSLPDVGRGYVGGLLADLAHPASVHVALAHALRLAELGFPEPASWDDLAQALRGGAPVSPPMVLEPLSQG